jgi:hypothetical protein
MQHHISSPLFHRILAVLPPKDPVSNFGFHPRSCWRSLLKCASLLFRPSINRTTCKTNTNSRIFRTNSLQIHFFSRFPHSPAYCNNTYHSNSYLHKREWQSVHTRTRPRVPAVPGEILRNSPRGRPASSAIRKTVSWLFLGPRCPSPSESPVGGSGRRLGETRSGLAAPGSRLSISGEL